MLIKRQGKTRLVLTPRTQWLQLLMTSARVRAVAGRPAGGSGGAHLAVRVQAMPIQD